MLIAVVSHLRRTRLPVRAVLDLMNSCNQKWLGLRGRVFRGRTRVMEAQVCHSLTNHERLVRNRSILRQKRRANVSNWLGQGISGRAFKRTFRKYKFFNF